MTPTSLILVEGNRLLREGLAAMVHHQEDIQIVAALGDRDNVLQKVQQLKPRVVLLDLGLRDRDNLQLVESITRELPDVKVIVMDLLPAQADIIEFVRAGVSGFLLKDATFDEFLKTIRLVARRDQRPAAAADRFALLGDRQPRGAAREGAPVVDRDADQARA